MEAARAAGVERIVYTSSVATLKPREDGQDADENDRAEATSAIGAYKKSKVAAERVVEALIERGFRLSWSARRRLWDRATSSPRRPAG